MAHGSPTRRADRYYFGEFRVEREGSLWRGDREIPLRPKAADVLAYLLDRAGEIVTRREVIDAVWPEGFIGDGTLAVCVNELRHALGDDARSPRYIATVHRRGYRFVPDVWTAPVADDGLAGPTRAFVGREAELALLDGWWAEARSGRPQVAFITGEAGLGKSTLVDLFARGVRARGQLMLGRGQCVEHFGEGEPYLPVFEALTELCHSPNGSAVRHALSSLAPTWLRQLPGQVEADELESLELRTLGATTARMLREIADAVDALTAERPLLLVLEDLHDGDPSTVELLAYLARRRHPAALLIVGTYRPMEAASPAHPLRGVVQDLRARSLCRYLPLKPLSASATEDYLARRLVPLRPSTALTTELVERTEGNPLFLVRLLDYLIERNLLEEADDQVRSTDRLDNLGVPSSLRQLIDRQIGHAGPAGEQLLGVASVAGVEFTVDVAAAALGDGVDPVEVEDRCERLARRTGVIAAAGATSLPDGTVASRYRFAHALYAEVLYEHHVSPARRANAHRRIGERMVAAHAPHFHGVAAELAMHFEQGGDDEQAIVYLGRAAQASLERSAHTEAQGHTRRALELLQETPAGSKRARSELGIRLTEATALTAAKGFHAPEVEQAYLKANALTADAGDEQSRVAVLYGLRNVKLSRGELGEAGRRATELAALAERSADPAMQLQAHNLLGWTQLFAGEARHAIVHIDRALEHYDPMAHRRLALLYGEDPGVVCRAYGAIVTWLVGRPARARKLSDEAFRLATDLAYPAGITQALWYAAVVHQLCGDVGRVRTLTDEILRMHDDFDLPLWAMLGTVLNGWSVALGGEPEAGVARIRQGMAQLAADGVGLIRPYYSALLAVACLRLGDAASARATVNEALDIARRSGERWFDAELLRLRAGLLLQGEADASNAEAGLLAAIEVARTQEARSLELRVATDLARLWQQRGDVTHARDLLSRAYGWFSEGHDTSDLQAAGSLLAELEYPEGHGGSSAGRAERTRQPVTHVRAGS
jgi:DNA-binding winged helix-turn-helix (wHTH) protein/predicted ATPase